MIILRQRTYAAPFTVTSMSGQAPKANNGPYAPNYNPNAGAKERTSAMLNNAKSSVGIKQGAINTWNNMSTGQRIATGAIASTALVGGAALLARNRQKRKEAERELELERARNRR